MTERMRPILKLKNPPKLAPIVPPKADWKCKPCGVAFAPATEANDEGEVRCPKCNARLGRLADFEANPAKVRARQMRQA
ncbi:MAG TPA: hypothetical protein VF138_13240 [Caulobacteraceae bacterium]